MLPLYVVVMWFMVSVLALFIVRSGKERMICSLVYINSGINVESRAFYLDSNGIDAQSRDF
jgi:hypothetical protein